MQSLSPFMQCIVIRTIGQTQIHLKPERFLEKGVNKNPAYLPFGKGSRFCLGSHLAMLEMNIVLKELYRHNVELEHK